MSNQSSIDWLISCVTEDQMVKSKSLNEWLEIFEQAKTKHKQEIIDAANKLLYHSTGPGDTAAKQYYNETYGGQDESNH